MPIGRSLRLSLRKRKLDEYTHVTVGVCQPEVKKVESRSKLNVGPIHHGHVEGQHRAVEVLHGVIPRQLPPDSDRVDEAASRPRPAGHICEAGSGT
ncbi:hypothetical protein E2C01_064357 [Portunus trituberculatus]|uniref:Uncharacterized protein n=1 Tax=Portunus trituberculatus TaxID=210409 RepID=A0A5B7HLK2_PORTR|nr:hypothetical protein [Portunus trituberculatus]